MRIHSTFHRLHCSFSRQIRGSFISLLYVTAVNPRENRSELDILFPSRSWGGEVVKGRENRKEKGWEKTGQAPTLLPFFLSPTSVNSRTPHSGYCPAQISHAVVCSPSPTPYSSLNEFLLNGSPLFAPLFGSSTCKEIRLLRYRYSVAHFVLSEAAHLRPLPWGVSGIGLDREEPTISWNRDIKWPKIQCSGAGAARSRNFWPEPELEPECRSFGSGFRLRVSLSSK